MPKVEIDYSNTIFYKIFCKNPEIIDLYVGHTTNFVQRKYGHKQNCINMKSPNYKYKLYNFIRNNGGWDNWNMEIIAFHNCDDHYHARKKEQHYYKELNATLNSIEPYAIKKEKKEKENIEKKILYCNSCKVYFNTSRMHETHNKTNKHIKRIQMDDKENKESLYCEKCNYNCSYISEYNRHLLTAKHKMMTHDDTKTDKKQVTSNEFICDCGKEYRHRQGLHKHKKKCTYLEEKEEEKEEAVIVKKEEEPDYKELLVKAMTQMSKQQTQLAEQQKQIAEMITNVANNNMTKKTDPIL